MLQIYRRFWQVTWAEQWQYRANFMMYLLYWIVEPVIYLAVWTTIANANGDVSGLTADDFVVYYMTLLIVDQLTSEITLHVFPYKIQDGSLSAELLRPVHPLLTNTLTYNISFKALIFLVFLPIWCLLFLIFRPDYSMVTAQSLLLAVPAVVMGFGISFLLGAAVASLAFWTTRVYSIGEFYDALFMLFSGLFVPLALMPELIQQIASYLPFQFAVYFPIQVILNQLSPEQIMRGFAVGLIWLAAAYLVFRWVWKNGLKQYSAVGA